MNSFKHISTSTYLIEWIFNSAKLFNISFNPIIFHKILGFQPQDTPTPLCQVIGHIETNEKSRKKVSRICKIKRFGDFPTWLGKDNLLSEMMEIKLYEKSMHLNESLTSDIILQRNVIYWQYSFIGNNTAENMKIRNSFRGIIHKFI